ncbi:hypothetical protein [Inquilinus sp.]|jgi:hypothetical protein|uniref:hypothetical protein n=1 Tax=Inquilinus sp. TaxID=1932117 RepID=UPI00378375DD
MQTLSAFPTRPLRVHAPKPKTIRRILLLIVLELVLLALLAALFVWMAPPLLNDARIRQNPAIAEDGELVNGKCQTKLVMTFCDATLSAPGPDGTAVRSDVSYFLLDLHFGDYDTEVVQSADDPHLLTTTLGLDYFWDRVLCFAAAVVLLVIGIIGMVRGTFRQNRGEREAVALDGQVLTPVPVTILSGRKVRRVITWKFSYPAAGREAKVNVNTNKDFLPFTLDSRGKRALAVTGAAGGTPLLLDAGLSQLELTEPERTALLQAQQQDQAAG